LNIFNTFYACERSRTFFASLITKLAYFLLNYWNKLRAFTNAKSSATLEICFTKKTIILKRIWNKITTCNIRWRSWRNTCLRCKRRRWSLGVWRRKSRQANRPNDDRTRCARDDSTTVSSWTFRLEEKNNNKIHLFILKNF
jgi:hypothetical protein